LDSARIVVRGETYSSGATGVLAVNESTLVVVEAPYFPGGTTFDVEIAARAGEQVSVLADEDPLGASWSLTAP
jgi:hypothetical protein